MKIRKFYPAQVMRELHGRDVAALAKSDLAVLDVGMRRARKAGVLVTIVAGVVAVHSPKQVGQMILADLKEVVAKRFSGVTKEQAEAVIANANNRIFLKMAD